MEISTFPALLSLFDNDLVMNTAFIITISLILGVIMFFALRSRIRNRRIPVLSCTATISGKREFKPKKEGMTKRYGAYLADFDNATQLNYRGDSLVYDGNPDKDFIFLIKFTLTDGSNIELQVPKKEYDNFSLDSRGMLTYRGSKLISFH